ncbi:MAG TPA: hypothetical protein VK576_09990 [Thermoleophilia bacterium]|nr:hypothetical protein [Thermoleophilia bacterium]
MTRINLLPPEERTKAAREQGLLLAVVALVILVAALGAVYFMAHRQVVDKQGQVDEISAQVAAANMQLAKLTPYETMQTQRQQMATTAAQLDTARVNWSSILEEVALLIPDNVSLRTMTSTVPPYMVAGANNLQTSTATTTVGVDFTLQGDATGATTYEAHDQVAEFMTRLGLMPQLMNIKLASSQIPDATKVDVQFTITASLRPFAVTPPLAPPAPTLTMGGGQ